MTTILNFCGNLKILFILKTVSDRLILAKFWVLRTHSSFRLYFCGYILHLWLLGLVIIRIKPLLLHKYLNKMYRKIKLTSTILLHCVPFPAPGPPNTKTTFGFVMFLNVLMLLFNAVCKIVAVTMQSENKQSVPVNSVRNSPWPRGQGPRLFKLGPPQLDFHGPQWATTLTTTCLMW